MWECVEYLKKPELVVAVQEFFGVKYLSETAESKQTNQRATQVNHHSSGSSGHDDSDESDDKVPPYRITNRFWYYLFRLGTELGDEIFYATFIPFWFWNIDGAVGRRVVFVWSAVMYIGQGLKDLIRWPRPGLPVYRLQNKWAIEYGMPSTHAMVAISIPFSVLIYTLER